MARDASQNAQALRIDRGGGVVLPGCFACRRERQFQTGKILGNVAYGLGVLGALPISVEVRMPVGRAWTLSRSGHARYGEDREESRQESHLDARVYEAVHLRQ